MRASDRTYCHAFAGIMTIILLFIPALLTSGQDNKSTLPFEKILFQDFVDTLESSVPVRLYYSDKWTDTMYLKVNSENSSLNDLLNSTLRKSGFFFFITADNKVILSKGYNIKTDFRQEYLDHLKKILPEEDTADLILPPKSEEESTISDEYRIFQIGKQVSGRQESNAVLSGIIKEAENGNAVSGAVVYVEKLRSGVMTNSSGYYSIELPPGQYRLEYRMIGMKTARRNIIIYSDGVLDVQMEETTSELDEVVVTGARNNVRDVSTGIVKLNNKMLRQIPMGLGEADLLKSTLLLPGVQTVGEASSGFSIRGGSIDQNLIFLNSAPILNPSHFFGFFSAFNSDLISDVTIYKSGMPARFGGRLSSVMDISPAEGNKERLKVNGGISPLTGRISIDGPVGKSKTTIILGARTTYSDWLLGMLDDYRLRESSAGFYDIQGLVRHDLDEKNYITLSGYFSQDRFNYFNERAFSYGSIASTIKWNHTFSQKTSAKFYLISSGYRYLLNSNEDSTQANSMKYNIAQRIIRAEFQHFHSEKHKLEFGTDATLYSLSPGERSPMGIHSKIIEKSLEKERAAESSLFLSDEYELTPLLSLSMGVRSTFFTLIGPGSEMKYSESAPRSEENITDTLIYNRGEIIKIYPGIDYRITSRFMIAPRSSVKLGGQRIHQFIHMISNTTSMSPSDTWKLSDSYLKPQISDQLSLGLYHTLGKNGIELSLETYYKALKNILDYKGGASLIMNEHLETDVISGRGKAYGVELLVSKQSGTVNGWIGYTYSRTFLRIDGIFDSEKINRGKYYPADYDKPHDLKFVINTKLSRRFNVTSNFMYSTGRPITFPVAFYNFTNGNHVYYSDRNEYRIPDYIRLDLSATINGNLKERKLNHSSFTFTVYNLFGRKNPYSIYFRTEDGLIKGYQMSIFGQPVFMFSYNFRIFGNASGDF